MNNYLFASINDILRVGKTSGAGSADNRVMAWRSVGHTHGAELEERFPNGNTTEEQLAMTRIAGSIFM